MVGWIEGGAGLFFLVFHGALPDLQRMKHKPDQAFEHREVFCFFLAFCLAARSSYRVDRGRHLASSTFGGVVALRRWLQPPC